MIDEPALRAAIAANIIRLRQQRGWSQNELAQQARISRVQLSRIENQHCTPGADVLFSLADVFGTSADSLRQVAENLAAESA